MVRATGTGIHVRAHKDFGSICKNVSSYSSPSSGVFGVEVEVAHASIDHSEAIASTFLDGGHADSHGR